MSRRRRTPPLPLNVTVTSAHAGLGAEPDVMPFLDELLAEGRRLVAQRGTGAGEAANGATVDASGGARDPGTP